jgi:hypothetical protein
MVEVHTMSQRDNVFPQEKIRSLLCIEDVNTRAAFVKLEVETIREIGLLVTFVAVMLAQELGYHLQFL